ncbi:MAG: aminoglycoside adenylyltransferase domain-containing protein [Bacillota bacterium]
MQPTPYPDVNALLSELLSSLRGILGDRFVGLYLHGSLAAGDFVRGRSDIDFLVVTDGDLSDEVVAVLKAMHERLLASGLPMAAELEGSYIPRGAMGRYDRARARHPHIESGGHTLRVEQHDSDWSVQRHVLREHGITVAGPPIASLVDPLGPDELRRAIVDLVRSWWAPMLDDPAKLRRGKYQAYAVLTMGRILYTLEHGTVVSKRAAASWARQTVARRWAGLIDLALTGDLTRPLGKLDDTRDLIRYTASQCERWHRTGQGPESPPE